MDQDLIKLLENSGFTQKEAQVYLALLELSEGTVSQIAKTTKLKRPIIYVVLEGLIKRGFANELPERKVNVYQPINPTVILGQLKMSAKNFAQMLPILQTLGNDRKKKPKIRFYDNKEDILKIWDGVITSYSIHYTKLYDFKAF